MRTRRVMEQRKGKEFTPDCRGVNAERSSSSADSAGRRIREVGTLLLFMLLFGFTAALAEEEGKSSAELVRMGDEAFESGRYSTAVELYRSAVKADEGNSQARLKLIELLARLDGKEDEARKEMDVALAMEGLTAEEIGLIAEICSENGFPDRAASAYKRLLKSNPADLSCLNKLMEVLLSGKDVDRARSEVEAYRGSSFAGIAGLELIASRCAERSQYELARLAYEGILEKNEKNLSAMLGISRCLTMLGNLSEAGERLKHAAESHPKRREPVIALGELFARTGDYRGAEAAFEEVREMDPKGAEVAKGYARVMFETGRYKEAREALNEALEANPGSPVLLVSLGQVLNYVGEYESAQERFREALAAQPAYPDAILGLGISYRETGRLAEAKEQFVRLYDFWDTYVGKLDSVRPQDMVDVAVACAFTDNPQNAVDVLEEVLKRDRVNGEALLWEARLFSERHQPADAQRELKKLLSINPNDPEAHAELASIHLDSNRYDLAEESCEQALKTNPNHIRALDILSSIRILDFEYRKGEETVKKALTINPRSLSSLSCLASCYWQEGKKDAYEEIREKVLKINPVYSEFYSTVARACENRRSNKEAIGLLKEAISLKPDYTPGYTNIGILLMREGEEEEAETYLRKSYRLDSYNPKTTNFINLLEHMKKNFVSTRTEHFLLKWEREEGSVLGFFLPEYVEQVYKEVCGEFGFEPKNPTLVEIFDSHDQFSARIVGLPFIATVGASLGKVVAADCPKSASFDWKDVLRHEFVHVVNLQQSRMQIPFWFTEGLATCSEESPLPAAWDGLIVRMLYLNRIIPLEDLNSCFTRPRTVTHKQAAYAESSLICRYLYKKHGREAIAKMIDMYGENRPTEEVVRDCLSMSVEEFERNAKDYVLTRAREIKVSPEFLQGDAEAITKALGEQPENVLLQVARSRMLLQEAVLSPKDVRDAKLNEAAQILEKVISVNPGTRGAYSTMAEIHLVGGENEKAKCAALNAVAIDEEDFVAHRCLGLVYQVTENKEDAVKELVKAAEVYPRSPDVWYALASLYSEQKDEEGMTRALEGALEADRKNVETAKRLAQIYLSKNDYERAVTIAGRALRCDLYDAELYKLLVQAFDGKKDEKTARRYAKIGAEAAYVTAKSLMPFQRERVIELLNLSLELDPEHEMSKSLLSQIEN